MELTEITDEEDKLDAMNAVTDWLQPVLFALVTQAERDFRGGVGRLKLATVIKEVTALLPDKIKCLVDTDWLAEQAESALKKARMAWTENPGLAESLVMKTYEKTLEANKAYKVLVDKQIALFEENNSETKKRAENEDIDAAVGATNTEPGELEGGQTDKDTPSGEAAEEPAIEPGAGDALPAGSACD